MVLSYFTCCLQNRLALSILTLFSCNGSKGKFEISKLQCVYCQGLSEIDFAVLIRICSSFPSFTQEVNCNTHPLGIVISICSQTLLILGNHKYMNYNFHILVEPFNLQENCKETKLSKYTEKMGFFPYCWFSLGGSVYEFKSGIG